jgi:predicted alpha/beta hydrolase
MEAETHSVVTANGRSIQATFYSPSGTVHTAVLIVNAMGVSQKFYAPLASWLADGGYLAATFDYAGIGQSRVPDLTKLDVDILDWARFDCDAMLVEWLRRSRPASAATFPASADARWATGLRASSDNGAAGA